MNVLVAGLKKLVQSLDANQRQILKDTLHETLDAYSNLPSLILSPVKNALDKFVDRFLDDSQ